MNTDLLLRRLLGTRGVATQWHSTKPLTGIKQETCNCKFPLLGKRIHAVEMFIYSEKLTLRNYRLDGNGLQMHRDKALQLNKNPVHLSKSYVQLYKH